HRNRFLSETFAQASSLVASDIGEKNVNGAGEAIFGAQLGGAVADEGDARGHARILLQKKEARDLWSREPVLGPLTSTRRHSNRLLPRISLRPFRGVPARSQLQRSVRVETRFVIHRITKRPDTPLTSAMEHPT